VAKVAWSSSTSRLKTLTVIQTAVALADADRKTRGEPRSTWRHSAGRRRGVPDISAADVTGVFQLESSGFRDPVKKLKPDCFEDIVAAGRALPSCPIGRDGG